ncbi:hypothetical protein FIBSPDRAFT_855184 [Athelia psychrophila]|uniref:Uncharacterized protein n=1 Tax=Athelia psychrophila TaxID=1759441 RepID=A0A166PLP6_9AGAM|nr:hypothetical protein FIBSPDRAFT_855184 [Fibularhizoctonia sp. CBS 109695]
MSLTSQVSTIVRAPRLFCPPLRSETRLHRSRLDCPLIESSRGRRIGRESHIFIVHRASVA